MSKNYRSEAIDAVEEQFGNIDDDIYDIFEGVDYLEYLTIMIKNTINKDEYNVDEAEDILDDLQTSIKDVKKLIANLREKLK